MLMENLLALFSEVLTHCELVIIHSNSSTYVIRRCVCGFAAVNKRTAVEAVVGPQQLFRGCEQRLSCCLDTRNFSSQK